MRTVQRTHGLASTYTNGKCRCEQCRGAAAIYYQKKNATPEYRAGHNAYQKRYYAERMTDDPAFREQVRAVRRKSAAKMRTIPEKWERAKAKARKATRARRDLIQQIKLERGCADCGYRAHPEALEFHHRDTATKFAAVSRIKTLSMETLLAEIEKCEVLCANCHRIRTYNERHQKDAAITD